MPSEAILICEINRYVKLIEMITRPDHEEHMGRFILERD